MAKVYAAPVASVGPVPMTDYRNLPTTADGKTDWKTARAAEDKAETEWLEKVRAWVKANSKHPKSPLVGKEVAWGFADGYARYMVMDTSPVTLIHLPLGDAWNLPAAHLRGINLKDIKQQVEGERLFGSL